MSDDYPRGAIVALVRPLRYGNTTLQVGWHLRVLAATGAEHLECHAAGTGDTLTVPAAAVELVQAAPPPPKQRRKATLKEAVRSGRVKAGSDLGGEPC